MQAHPFILAALVPLAGCIAPTNGVPTSNPQPVAFMDEIETDADGRCFARALVSAPEIEAATLEDGTDILPQVETSALDAPILDAAPAPIEIADTTADITADPVDSSTAFEAVMSSVESPEAVSGLEEVLLAPDDHILYFMGLDRLLPQSQPDVALLDTTNRFETLCPADYSPALISDLQRALAVRDTYDGPISGLMDAQTVEAISTFQAAQGVNSGLLGRETARDLGLITLTDAERDALDSL